MLNVTDLICALLAVILFGWLLSADQPQVVHVAAKGDKQWTVIVKQPVPSPRRKRVPPPVLRPAFELEA